MPCLELFTFGTFQAVHDEQPLTDFESDKARALLAFLAVESDRPHRREFLAGQFWPESSDSKARTNLRSALANIRQVIHDHQADPAYLNITRQTIQLNTASDIWLDLQEFVDRLEQPDLENLAQEADVVSDQSSSQQISTLEKAVDLYRDEFLMGFFLDGCPQFDNWVLITRESLQRQAIQGLHQLVIYHQNKGQHEKALKYARRQVELEPFQEDAHQQVMWSLAMLGRRNEALLHYDRFNQMLQEELGVDPLEQTREMHARILQEQVPSTPAPLPVLRREPKTVGENPYRGLAAFQESDSEFFFGREAFVGNLKDSIHDPAPVTMVIGPSGSGKSSVLFAGLIPALRLEKERLILEFRPGEQPFYSAANVLLPLLNPCVTGAERKPQALELSESLLVGDDYLIDLLDLVLECHPDYSHLLLAIDQFEEMFTLCRDEVVCTRFLDSLLEVIQKQSSDPAGIRLLLTLRADFLGQVISHRPFAEIMRDRIRILGPMNREELRQAVEEPALLQGAAFEPGLVARILNDIGEEPGNLPLLEFALTLLWNQLDQGWLTHASYEQIGGVKGALLGYAEEIFLSLDEDNQHSARQVLTQLVQPGHGTEDTRRIARRSDFRNQGWDLVQLLADKRLVVTGIDNDGQEVAEIIHEALIREWDRLQSWMEADRAFRLWQETLRSALDQWQESGQDETALLHGVALTNAESWLQSRKEDLNEPEIQFIQASQARQKEALEAELLRQQRESSLERRSRSFLWALVVVLLVATGVSIGFALLARQETRQAVEASSLSLAANARQALNDRDTSTALMLAMAANRIDRPPSESQRVLLEAAYSAGPRNVLNAFELYEEIDGPPISLAVHPVEQSMLLGFPDGNILLVDMQSGEELRRYSGHQQGTYEPASIRPYKGVNDLAFTPDGKTAISAGEDGLAIVWDVESGEQEAKVDVHSGPVRTLEISDDGQVVLSGGAAGPAEDRQGELLLWELGSGDVLQRYEGNLDVVVDASLSSDTDRLVASAGEVDYLTTPELREYSLILWESKTGQIVHEVENLDRDIPAVAINPLCDPDEKDPGLLVCGNQALLGSTDHNLYTWDLKTGDLLLTLEGHTDLVRRVVYSPDGRRALSGGGDGEIIYWNLEEGEILARLDAHLEGVNDIEFTSDSRHAVSVANDGRIVFWDLTNAAQKESYQGHQAAVLDVAYIPGSSQFVSASGLFDPAAPVIEEDSLRIWSLESGQQTGTLDWHLSDIFQVAVSPDGRRALTGLMIDQSVRLWDLATGREIRKFEGHQMPVLSAAFAPDGESGLTGDVNSTIIVWDLATGQELNRFTGHEGGIWGLAVSPDGRTLLSGSDDRLMIWWDLETGEELGRFEGHGETVSGVAFSPDGSRAISGETEGPLIEWDLESGQEIQRFSGHEGTGPMGRTRVAYTPDGRQILSSGWDGTLALWDVATGQELHRFHGHAADFIFDLAVHPDGKSALSCGTDNTIIEWNLDLPESQELFNWIDANRFVRELSCTERELYQIEPLCTPESE
jgi:WD40 repeat protein/DNA-binding SARP family transcriptional activator